MLPEIVRAASENQRLKVATLFQFEFLSETKRFHDGVRTLTAGGYDWEGSADVISVSGMDRGRNLAASQVTFTLSTGSHGELLSFAAGNQAEVWNRPCAVFIQFLTAAEVVLDTPIALWAGNMDTMDFAVGGNNQQIRLTAEGLFISRIRTPHGYQTDSDQQARWPGDRGMEFMPSLRNKTVPWLRG